jgi:diaminopimelate decarboxylase
MSVESMLDDMRRDVLFDVAQRYGTPSFVYFMDDVRARIAELRSVFGNRFAVSYAMKCNPNPGLLGWMRDHADTLDVSSAGELRAGLQAGWAPTRISFTGPAKQRADLALAVRERIGEVVIESLREAILLDEEARGANMKQKVLIRIAPAHVPRGFGSNMSGKPTQFGIDEENLAEELHAIARLQHLTVAGFHAYSGTQCLKADAVAENWLNFLRLFELGSEILNIQPEKLIFGSGLGIRYHDGDSAIALPAVASAVAPSLDLMRSMPRYSAAQLMLETGRFLVGEAGVYLTRVVHTKVSRGRRIVVLDGGMNHHLGAAGHLGMLIHRPYRMEVIAARSPVDSPAEPQDLYGPLCTTIDTFGRGVKLPRLSVGDLLVVHCSGAYGPSSSPSGFISHPRAREFMVTGTPESPELQDWSFD